MFRADNVKVGGTIGFSYWDVEGALTGDGTLTKPDGSTQEGSFEKGFGIKAPVPVIGIVVDGAISKDVLFNFYVRALFLNLDEASGGTLSGGVNAKWYFTKHLGVGAGLDINTIKIDDYVKDDKRFSANYTFAGPPLPRRVVLSPGGAPSAGGAPRDLPQARGDRAEACDERLDGGVRPRRVAASEEVDGGFAPLGQV